MTAQDQDRATIADLELYGLPLRTINLLEKQFGFLYVDQLAGLTPESLLAVPNSGPTVLATLQQALRDWIANRPVKTVAACVEMGGSDAA